MSVLNIAYNKMIFYLTPLESSCSFCCLDSILYSSGTTSCCIVQASQSGYAVDYVAQGQAGFPGSYLNQNSQPGYPHLGSGNDFMTQVDGLQKSFSLP